MIATLRYPKRGRAKRVSAGHSSHQPGGGPPRPLRRSWLLLAVSLAVLGCGDGPWNRPYPAEEIARVLVFSSFRERPAHLDPARACSSDEYEFLAQIYEPPLQYHYLKRPYQLVPLTAAAVPHPLYHDSHGRRLAEDTPAEKIVDSVYEIEIRPGIYYQPHPAFARDAHGRYLYHTLDSDLFEGLHELGDLPQTGTWWRQTTSTRSSGSPIPHCTVQLPV
jgi:oligopeptide transport system substrate-binding protein